MKIFEKIFDLIFSFEMFLFLIFGGFGTVLYIVVINDVEQREQIRAQTMFCYNLGQVPVETAAGPRCADPKSLQVIK